MFLKRMLSPVLTGFRKDNPEKSERLTGEMSHKEEIALKEARKIVRVYGSKVVHPFKYGQGSLDK